MYSITDEEFKHKYQTVFQSIFSLNAEFNDFWFQNSLSHRLLIYPQMFSLNNSQFSALAKAASLHGETEFVLSISELFESKKTKHWLISLDDFHAYHSVKLNKMLENVIFSISGNWGIRFTQDMFAIVAGSEPFLSNLVQQWPEDFRNNIPNFLTDLKEDSSVNRVWLKAFLEHVCGKTQAQQFLLEFEFI
ncbi:MAG: hypothetical protein CL608_32215 [Anaerolineaceae bacterium]|nr:hypothetical protein [Anaerolineaceae bacterium]